MRGMQKEKERSVLDKSFLHPLQKIRLLWEQIHKIELKEKNIMKRTPIVLISVFAAAIQLLSASEEVKLSTKRLDVTIKDARIINVYDKIAKKTWASPKGETFNMPAGLGILTDLTNFRNAHRYWGEMGMYHNPRNLPPYSLQPNYFNPCDQTTTVQKQENGWNVIAWKGLSNGKTYLPEAELVLRWRENQTGALELKLSGRNPEGKVFGTAIPVISVVGSEHMLIPHAGGRILHNNSVDNITLSGYYLCMEAPLSIVEHEGKSLALWMEDAKFNPFQMYIGRNKKNFSFGFENNNLMPFDETTQADSPSVFLNTFDGDWKAAATPYRNWFQKTFAKEIKQRDAVAWAKNVYTIYCIQSSQAFPNEQEMKLLRKYYPESSLMFMDFGARAASFDHGLPDNTPRPGYVDYVKLAHRYNFKTMAYTCAMGACYKSELWIKDKLQEKMIPQSNALSMYIPNGPHRSGRLLGINSFADLRPGQIVYSDSLSAPWRAYHIKKQREWNSKTKTDANYEDTLGIGADMGNGIVDGMNGIESDMAMARELLLAQPGVPIAAEYGPAPIASSISWALKIPVNWGTIQYKKSLIYDQRPLSSYLFGYTQWSCGKKINGSDMLAHMYAATGDALGGLGFGTDRYYMNSKEFIDNDESFTGHIHQRAVFFAKNGLKVYFPKGDYPKNVICCYKDKAGKIYNYYDDGQIQELRDENGKFIYGRVSNACKIKTDARISRWPFQQDGWISGLNPQRHYPLFAQIKKEAGMKGGILPDKVVLKSYLETPEAIYCEIDALPGGPKTIHFNPQLPRKYQKMILNGKAVKKLDCKVDLPMQFVAMDISGSRDFTDASLVSVPYAVTEGNSIKFKDLNVKEGKFSRMMMPGPRIVLPLKIQKGDALAMNFRDRSDPGAFPIDGVIFRVLVNGRELKRFDSCPHPSFSATMSIADRGKLLDITEQNWLIPLDSFAGQDVLLVIEVDSKDTHIGDRPMMTVPKLVKFSGNSPAATSSSNDKKANIKKEEKRKDSKKLQDLDGYQLSPHAL